MNGVIYSILPRPRYILICYLFNSLLTDVVSPKWDDHLVIDEEAQAFEQLQCVC